MAASDLIAVQIAEQGVAYLCTRQEVTQALESNLLSWTHLLTDQEMETRALTKDWVQTRFRDWIRQDNRQITDLSAELGALGAFGGNFRGSSRPLNSVGRGLMFQELEKGDSELRYFSSTQSSLVMQSILKFGSEEQRTRYLPDLVQGKLLGCFGLTEAPDGMSAVKAIREGETYILNGTKTWVAGAPNANLAIIWAKVQNEERTCGFIVERQAGMTTTHFPEPFSIGICPMGEVHLTDCKVAAGQVLTGAQGISSSLNCLTAAREAAAWGVTGAALSCYEIALNHSTRISEFGRPIAESQAYQGSLADMAGHIVTSQLLSLHYGRCSEMQQLSPLQVNLHKRNNVASALKVAQAARKILGSEVLSPTCHLLPLLHKIEQAALLDGSDTLQASVIGAALTGVWANS